MYYMSSRKQMNMDMGVSYHSSDGSSSTAPTLKDPIKEDDGKRLTFCLNKLSSFLTEPL